MSLTWKTILLGVGAVVTVAALAWFFFPDSQTNQPPTNEEFGTGENRTFTPTSGGGSETGSPTASSTTRTQKEIVFKISDGPVAGATFVQTFRPTTTLARFVMSTNGHVADLVVDSSGAIPRAVSNTTIPGVVRAQWGEGGSATVLEYLDGTTIKTAYLGFPAPSTSSGQATTTATSTLNRAVRLQFLPDGIADYAVSPDGRSVGYLLKTATGVDGYIAKIDGTGSKKLFSLPLSEILLTWPSPNILLAQTKSAANTPGAAFSINTTSGAVVPLIFAQGLTANADRAFSRVIYQTVDTARSSYIHSIQSGMDIPLSFDPTPEKCSWSTISTTTIFCAAPSQYVPTNYLDLWHQGRTSNTDSIFAFSTITGRSNIVAAPGGSQGGISSDIVEMTQSSDGRYLLFIKKGDRSLWGVRL